MFDQNNPDSLLAIGLMSGTSMDGVDLAACAFEYKDGRWDFTLKKAVTIPYPDEWIKVMQSLPTVPSQEVFRIDAALGKYFGLLINDFITDLPEKPRLIGSHGHTLFHQPEAGFTTQVGSGAHIAAVTGIDTICDFRSKDVALGGHGAPLVPVGDHYLFPQYEACLNLGGFANISMLENGKRIAYDICPVNMPLNALAERTNNRYDHHGELARSGTILPELLEKLNRLDFYTKSGAKSLGREWYESNFLPLERMV